MVQHQSRKKMNYIGGGIANRLCLISKFCLRLASLKITASYSLKIFLYTLYFDESINDN